MYSSRIQKLLKKENIEIGDEISATAKHITHTGVLMPRAQGNPDILVIKLSSGYNVGINFEGLELKLIKKGALRKTYVEPHKPAKGDVAILGCGGTIASKIEYRTGAVFPAISAAELRAAFPGLEKMASIHSKKIFSLLSEDMSTHHWKLLADAIEDELKGGARGIVVMHGTDTMTYTAAAMSFIFQNLPVPVVFVGAQRSSDRPSSENEMNMSNAVYSALQDVGEVSVCMHASINDDYCFLHHGTKVRKMHTSRRDAFRPINSPPLALVDYSAKRFEPLSEYRKRSKPKELKVEKKLSHNIAMLYAYPGIKPELIESMDKYDGLVLIGTGLGHFLTNAFDDKIAKSTVPAIKGLVDSGIPVVMSPQTISGRLCMRTYTAGRLLLEAGVIGDGMDWTPEAAYAKLCWVRGQTKSMKKIRELMLTNLAGEINNRSPLEGYQ
ncbi:TPA: Glu-tRNA(Gln) amidotransferase subunit GatD [Candidatus Micrarchaeota archaeon]|nr:Glu-tRNA(Gln) amidotransferase subunit GatD [Candidatus Micrarchaeota archaeon]